MPQQFDHQTAVLASLNTRAELNGNDRVSATDLDVSMNVSNDRLALFHPMLRPLLYTKTGDGGDLANQGTEAPNLVFPHLEGPLKWKEQMIGATLTLHSGVTDLEMGGVKVHKWRIDPKEGGTVCLSFQVQGHPTSEQVARLYELIQQPIEFSLRPPTEEEALAAAKEPA